MLSLHNHSYYTLLKGTNSPDQLIGFAKADCSGYMALTDTNSMQGLIKFAKKAREENIKPLLGAHIDDPSQSGLQAVLLARNNAGYSRLCRIITRRNLLDHFSLIEELNDTDNLFVITSSMELLTALKERNLLKDNLYAELIVTAQLKGATRQLYEFAKANNIKIVASHPSYFASPDDYHLHRVVTAIRLNTNLKNLDERELVDKEFYLKHSSEMLNTWRTLPEAMANLEYIAGECNADLEIGSYKFPEFPLPKGETAYSLLWKTAFQGLSEKYKPITDKAASRLHYELDVIAEMGFTDYFLIIWDIVSEAHKRGMITIGRGSAANSLVAYCLGFTNVDPLAHDLYFERFLNRGRLSPPDVDIDFSWKERDQIVRYVYEKYGYSSVAMISTMVTFKARSAFRETAKAFGIPDSEISKYSRLIPWTSARNLPEIHKKSPETKTLKFDFEPWSTIVHFASRLADFPDHMSIHPSGIVITAGSITDYVALEYAKNKGLGLIVTQPDMYSIEDMGLVKIDLLSQRSLAVLKDTLGQIGKGRRG